MRELNYYLVMASLPALPPRFDLERTPISSARIEARLALLPADDLIQLDQMTAFLRWERHPPEATDAEVLEEYARLMRTLPNRIGRRIVELFVESRLIVASLRRRRRELPPFAGEQTPLLDWIRRRWAQPYFALQTERPWIVGLDRKLAADDLLAADTVLLDTVWRWLLAETPRYAFSFEALLIYLARYEIILRWAARDADRGRERFEQLLTEALGEYAALQG